MRQQREIIIQIQCRKLPGTRFEQRTAVRLGIQKRREVIDDVPADADCVTFRAVLKVAESGTAKPNFLGPYVHGKPDDRFLYLCWGEWTERGWDGFRRAKVSLKSLGWDRLNEAWGNGEPIKLTVEMTDTKGGPRCGSGIIV